MEVLKIIDRSEPKSSMVNYWILSKYYIQYAVIEATSEMLTLGGEKCFEYTKDDENTWAQDEVGNLTIKELKKEC